MQRTQATDPPLTCGLLSSRGACGNSPRLSQVGGLPVWHARPHTLDLGPGAGGGTHLEQIKLSSRALVTFVCEKQVAKDLCACRGRGALRPDRTEPVRRSGSRVLSATEHKQAFVARPGVLTAGSQTGKGEPFLVEVC